MRTALFLDNQYRGGVDTFLIQLVNHWPDAEGIHLYCNRHHPGIVTIRSLVRRPIHITTYGDSLSWLLFSGKAKIPLDQFYLVRAAVVVLQKTMLPIIFIFNLFRFAAHFALSGSDTLIVVNGGYPASPAARSASIAWRLAGKRGPSIHNFHSHAIPVGQSGRWMQEKLDRAVLRSSSCFVTVSHSCERSLRQRAVFAHSDRIFVIPNGIADPGLGADGKIHAGNTLDCLMLGTYHAYKGHAYLLEAFSLIQAENPAARLLMYGDGSESDRIRIENLIEHFGLKGRALLRGFVTDPDALLREAGVLVLPSQAHESFGLTIVEAMARGVPVVATAVGGIPEVLENGVQGFLCSPADPSEFASALSRLLSSESLRRDFGAAGRQRYLEHFRAEEMSQAYHRLLRARLAN